MASIEFITKRIEGKKKEIAKLEKKIERIEKAKATNWQNNPYYYHEEDLKWTNRDLDEARASLAKYEAELETANQKANSRNVPAITEFLDEWKSRLTRFYMTGINEYYAERKKINEMYKDATYGSEQYEKAREMSRKLAVRVKGKFEEVPYKNRWGGTSYNKVKIEDGDLEIYAQYLVFTTQEEAVARLEKDLTEEYNRKYDFIIERTNAIVKTITDASGLRVGAKGDLNGYIIGTDGTAKVQTIGAGGYNIQCYHFRTLINRA